ncbi:MAG: transcription termination factor Rho [Verrucomicrobiales bacterium]
MSDEEKKKAPSAKAAKKKVAKKAAKKKAVSKTTSIAPAKAAAKKAAKKATTSSTAASPAPKTTAKKASKKKTASAATVDDRPAKKKQKKTSPPAIDAQPAAISSAPPAERKEQSQSSDGAAAAPIARADQAQNDRPERRNEGSDQRERRNEESTPQQREGEGRGQDQRRDDNRSREDGRDRRNHGNPAGGGNDRDRDNRGGRGRFGKNGRGRNRGKNRNRGDRDRPQQDRGENRDRDRERPTEIPTGPPEDGEGLLEISSKGFGFLRQRHRNFVPAPTDIFVTPEMVRNFGLRDGLWLDGVVRQGGRGPQLTEITKINGKDPSKYKNLPIFEELKAINPDKRLLLETTSERATMRVIDMMTPIGRGQRGLIVAPPRTGKTTILHDMADAVLKNHPGIHLIILLIDERPEEVTEFARSFPQAEVMASSNDSDVKAHIRMAELAIERAKRLVEAGEHVFILLDSITRLARASNRAVKGGGRAMSGGIDARALELPRRLFAAARNTRDAGSLTIVATALIETNNRGDDLIFQEFKGTGNMEVVLDRQISQQYIYPSVDIFRSGTRREELLLPAHQLEKIFLIRRGLAGHKPVEAIQRLLYFIEKFPSNAQMLLEIKPDR